MEVFKKVLKFIGKAVLFIVSIPFYMVYAIFKGFFEGFKEGSEKSKAKGEDDLEWIDELALVEAALDDGDDF